MLKMLRYPFWLCSCFFCCFYYYYYYYYYYCYAGYPTRRSQGTGLCAVYYH